MKKFLILLMLLASNYFGISQSPEAKKKIEAARIALITERLELTPDQAEKFWPVYREFGLKQREIRQEFNQQRRTFDPNKATEEENKKMLEMATQVKERQLKLEREYSDRILKVINTRQLNNLRKAENDFKEMLLKRIRTEQIKRQQQNRNEKRLNDRRN
ncbi:MAG: hypothetical protein AB8B73_09425 [Ekhidna sp.]